MIKQCGAFQLSRIRQTRIYAACQVRPRVHRARSCSLLYLQLYQEMHKWQDGRQKSVFVCLKVIRLFRTNIRLLVAAVSVFEYGAPLLCLLTILH